MNIQEILSTAKMLVSNNKGILAMDESFPTCNNRFAKYGIPETVEKRGEYRELLITTPGLGKFISGAILFDETIRQKTKRGVPLIKLAVDAGIIPGIKVDMGAKEMAGYPGEKITKGLDGLFDRLQNYYRMGARFAKWRAVIAISDTIPTKACIEANTFALAHYAALCQQAGLVPIVEPEILMDGSHTMQQCYDVTENVLYEVFEQLDAQGVQLEGILLKPNMILPGLACPKQETNEAIADATIKCFRSTVPETVPGITFLSGGQSPELASARLNEMNRKYKSEIPWQLSFSYGRALQQPALEIWNGKDENVDLAQQALYHRAKCNHAACSGTYNISMETTTITPLRPIYIKRHFSDI